MRNKTTPEQCDYVIVGAGSAGCVLAERLSDGGKYRVVLLEAGGKDTNPWIHIPLGYGRTMFDKRVNWMFETEPEPGLDNRRIKQPRGKVLGGSSSINGLVYVRGQAEDYDHWRDLGNPGWGFADVLPYFRKSEDQARGADFWHGVGGPLAVGRKKVPRIGKLDAVDSGRPPAARPPDEARDIQQKCRFRLRPAHQGPRFLARVRLREPATHRLRAGPREPGRGVPEPPSSQATAP